MLSDWAIERQKKFNVNKCDVMHIGEKHPSCTYGMTVSKLAFSIQERDLEIWESLPMSPDESVN